MATTHERLRRSAEAGSEAELKDFLRDPGCDALAKDGQGMTELMYAAWSGHVACIEILRPASEPLAKSHHGMTALMWAANKGRETCVGLLLPVSGTLARDDDGLTASGLASKHGHEGLARFIDAYALARSEEASLRVVGSPWGSAWTIYPKGARRGDHKARLKRRSAWRASMKS